MSEREYKAPSWKLLVLHAVIYGIGIAIMWIVFSNQNAASHGATYPWPAWFTTGWGIVVLAQFCNVFFDNNRNHADKYYEKFRYEKEH